MVCESKKYLHLYHPGSDSNEIIFCKISMPFSTLVLWARLGKEWLVSKQYFYCNIFPMYKETRLYRIANNLILP